MLAGVAKTTNTMHSNWQNSGKIYSLAASEWSAAYHHESDEAYKAYGGNDNQMKQDINKIFKQFRAYFVKNKIEDYYWSWKFPTKPDAKDPDKISGREHSYWWSLENVLETINGS